MNAWTRIVSLVLLLRLGSAAGALSAAVPTPGPAAPGSGSHPLPSPLPTPIRLFTPSPSVVRAAYGPASPTLVPTPRQIPQEDEEAWKPQEPADPRANPLPSADAGPHGPRPTRAPSPVPAPIQDMERVSTLVDHLAQDQLQIEALLRGSPSVDALTAAQQDCLRGLLADKDRTAALVKDQMDLNPLPLPEPTPTSVRLLNAPGSQPQP